MQAPPACASVVIDLERLRRQGAMALRRSRDGFVVDAVKPRGVNRPWAPAAAGDTGTAATTLAPAAPRARDATLAAADLQAEELNRSTPPFSRRGPSDHLGNHGVAPHLSPGREL